MLDPTDPTTRIALARVGQTLRGRWRLDHLLGVGGMASVYAATHRNGSRGAVKLLHPEKSLDAGVRERFLREGYVANRVDHPGVVAIIDDDAASDDVVYLVMELLEGQTLNERAAAFPGRRLPLADVIDVGDQVLDVLAAAHHKGIIHRDLKPDNLFWTREGRVKVLDFGIARVRDATDTSDRTRTGSVFGTPAFMPPEQALGETSMISALTDLWAVGATLFTLLSGRKVREDKSPNRVLLAAMTQPAPRLASVMPDAPPGLAAVIDRALAFDQKDRFPDARAMQHALRGCAAAPVRTAGGLGGPPPSVPVERTPSVTNVMPVAPSHDASDSDATMKAPDRIGQPFILGASLLTRPAAGAQAPSPPLGVHMTLPMHPPGGVQPPFASMDPIPRAAGEAQAPSLPLGPSGAHMTLPMHPPVYVGGPESPPNLPGGFRPSLASQAPEEPLTQPTTHPVSRDAQSPSPAKSSQRVMFVVIAAVLLTLGSGAFALLLLPSPDPEPAPSGTPARAAAVAPPSETETSAAPAPPSAAPSSAAAPASASAIPTSRPHGAPAKAKAAKKDPWDKF